MSKKRGKRPGLRARSNNARTAKKSAAPPPWSQPPMHFCEVECGAPPVGTRLLVRLRDGTYRHGMNLQGFFAVYDHHRDEYVTMAHPERITHWMEIVSPVPETVGDLIDTHSAMLDDAAPAMEEQPVLPATGDDLYV